MKQPKMGLFYGSSTCYTQMAAEKIKAELNDYDVELFNVAEVPLIQAQLFDYLIFGISTWDFGQLQEDWEDIWPETDDLNLTGKQVALFGLGDQVGYAQWFLDAMGYLHSKLLARGAKMIGYWPVEGYAFEQSKALTADARYFVGLALDDENQFDLTADRIALWCQQLRMELGSPQ